VLAARNRRFRVAAALAGVSWLLFGALEIIDADHLFHEVVRGGYNVSAALFVAVHLVGACGFFAIAIAFGAKIDWRRMRLGATIVASVNIAYFVAWVFRTIAVYADTDNVDTRSYYVWMAAGTLLFGVGLGIAASGLAEGRRGPSRASRLWRGTILLVVSSVATTVGVGFLQAFYSGADAPHEFTTGLLVEAVGVFATAAAAMVFVYGARRPLRSREASLASAATVAVFATLCIVAGEVLYASAFSNHAAPAWEQVVAWLAVASRLALVFAFTAVAFGARTTGRAAPGDGEFAVIDAMRG
jgi:hypothetical protein